MADRPPLPDPPDPLTDNDDTTPGERERSLEGTLLEDVSFAAVIRERRPHVLEQIAGPGTPARFVLTRDQVLIGRGTNAEIVIASTRLSRKHAVVSRSGQDYVCRDLESSNGVFLNGVRISAAVLRDGDTLQLGDVVLIYHQGD